MIKVELIGDQLMVAKMQEREGLVRDSLRASIQRSAIELQRCVKEKLSGEVLHNRSGNLRSSINQQIIEEGDSIVGAVGTNVVYAARHEYGFAGTETVSASIRRSRGQMATATYSYINKRGERVIKVRQTGRYGKSTGTINVRSFTRQANTPERSFLRSSLAELTVTIRNDMAMAVKRAIK